VPAHWLIVLALIWLGLAIVCALFIIADMLINKPLLMKVMRLVWPINALYMGPVAVWAYWTMDRVLPQQVAPADQAGQKQGQDMQKQAKEHKTQEPFWKLTFKAVTHCGSGCTLGDLLAEWIVFFAAWEFAGRALWPEYIGDFTLAYIFGIAFQFFTIAPMRGLGVKDGIWAAIKADTLSLTAFEIGLFAWMALSAFLFFHPPLHPDHVVFWFMMQVGMLVGFATTYPMNWWLLKKGVKEKM
jgi:hypothetical protein